MKYLSWSEVTKLLAAIRHDDEFAERDREMIMLMLHTGLRVGELCKLNVGHVACEGVVRDTLHVPSSIGKGGHERLIPLNTVARRAIMGLLAFNAEQGFAVNENAPLVVSKGGQRMCVRAVQYVVAGLRRRAGLDVVAVPHTMRHTMATNLLSACGNLTVVKSVLGHKRVTTTEIYTHPSREVLARAVEMMVDAS